MSQWGRRAGAVLAATFFLGLAATTDAATITASNCSATAIQNAINSARTGDTVIVPNGSCTWTSGITISGKGIVLRGESEGGVRITNSTEFGIIVTEDSSFHTEIAQFTATGSGFFLRVLPYSAPVDTGKAVLVHHLTVNDAMGIRADVNRGVFWALTVSGANSLNTNRTFLQCKPEILTKSWTTPSTMGTADVGGQSNLYLEDSTFTRVLQSAIDVDGNCRMVIRRNVFDNSALASHGADTAPYGLRHVEIYDNTFIFTNYGDCDGSRTVGIPYFIYLRGGTGVIADNAGLEDMSSCAWGRKPALNMTVRNLQHNSGPNPCWGANSSGGTMYPAPRQIGRGYVTGAGRDGRGRQYDTVDYVGDGEPLYIWNQNFSLSISDYGGGDCSAPDSTVNYAVAGRDYVYGTAKPGYAKFPYPHPLRSGQIGGASTPATTPQPPTNVRILPAS